MKKIFRHTLLGSLIAASAVMATSCSGDGKLSNSFVIMCDNSFERVEQPLTDVYEFQYPQYHALVKYVPESAAIDSIVNGKAQVVFAPRELTQAEVNKMKKDNHLVHQKMVAVDAIAFIVNDENDVNPFDALSLKEIGDILTGRITDWSQIWANNKSGQIQVVFDSNLSSTVAYLRDNKEVMNGAEFGKNISKTDSIQGVFDFVARNKGAIGVLGVSWLSPRLDTPNFTQEQFQELVDAQEVEGAQYNLQEAKKFHALKVRRNDSTEGFLPIQEYIRTGQYPLTRPMYVIATGHLGKHYFDFVTSPIGQKVILRTGVCPQFIHEEIYQLPEFAPMN